MRIQKLILFVMVNLAIYGFVAVDSAYSDMLDLDGRIGLKMQKIDEDYVAMSMFGKTATINTTQLGEKWNEFSNTVVAGLDSASSNIRQFIGAEEEKDYSVFNLQLL